MLIEERYAEAKKMYEKLRINTDEVIKTLSSVPVSMHCWQGDDVGGFDRQRSLTGGIQVTGNYFGKARTPNELMSDIKFVCGMVPGKHKLNLHASYAIFKDGEWVDRDQIKPEHFLQWISFAKMMNMGIDFNPTLFSHEKATDSLTLTNPDDKIRAFWIKHCKACLHIAEYFAKETGVPCVMNIWIPDGFKNKPADCIGPRKRYKDSLDQILAEPYDKKNVVVTIESKVFGIGLESYTAGSAEFCQSYCMKNNITPLLDNGHYHPTEQVSDKISSLLLFSEKVALHITHPVRWDSDHVALFDDDIKDICNEIVRCNALNRVYIATDYFDASINRIVAWVIGLRTVQKALLNALLQPNEKMKTLQNNNNNSELLMLQEEVKLLPIGDVWAYYCKQQNVPTDFEWYSYVQTYTKENLSKR